jgi:hypothetical protein
VVVAKVNRTTETVSNINGTVLQPKNEAPPVDKTVMTGGKPSWAAARHSGVNGREPAEPINQARLEGSHTAQGRVLHVTGSMRCLFLAPYLLV